MNILGRKRVLVIGAVCAMMGAVGLIVCLSGPKEPEYQGRKLSEWVVFGFEHRWGTEESNAAIDAIQRMGTNCIPFLVKWIAYEPSDKRMNALSTAQSLDLPVIKKAACAVLENSNQIARAEAALFGFEALGKTAYPAKARLEMLADAPWPVGARAKAATNSIYQAMSYPGHDEALRRRRRFEFQCGIE